MDPTQNISQIISLCITTSLDVEEKKTVELKTAIIAKRLIENEHSFLREPIQKTWWNKVCRFFRNTFYSKEVCQYKDLKENLAFIDDILAHTQSISFSVNKDQYKKLDALFQGDARKALMVFTERLKPTVSNLTHADELQALISHIQKVIPQEVVACKQSQKGLYYEAKGLVESLNRAKELTPDEIEKTKMRLVSIRQRVSEEDFPIIGELERALVKLEACEEYNRAKQKIQGYNMQTLLHNAESLLPDFEELIKARIDQLLDTFQSQACVTITTLQGDRAQCEKAFQELQATLLSLTVAPGTGLQKIMHYYSQKMSEVEVHVAESYFTAVLKSVQDDATAVLESDDTERLVKHKAFCEWLQAVLQVYENRNDKVFSPDGAFLSWQKGLNNELEGIKQRIDDKLGTIVEKEAPHVDFVQAPIGTRTIQWFTGVVASSVGYHFGFGDMVSQMFKVQSVSATCIALAVTFATHTSVGLSQGLPLSYAATFGFVNIGLPFFGKFVSFYGVPVGTIASGAVIYLAREPALNTIKLHYQTAWLTEYGGAPGTCLRWLLTTAGAGWYLGLGTITRLV